MQCEICSVPFEVYSMQKEVCSVPCEGNSVQCVQCDICAAHRRGSPVLRVPPWLYGAPIGGEKRLASHWSILSQVS